MALVNHQDIFDDFKLKLIEVMPKSREFNSAFAACCRKLARELNEKHKTALDEAMAIKAPPAPADDIEGFEGYTPEERSAKVGLLLDYKLHTKEMTASELREFKDIFNLKSQDQDIIIEQVSYVDIDPDNADIIKAVNWQIKAFNAD
jgi:hypothetical protein